MYTVLRSKAAQLVLPLALVAGGLGVSAAPAGASATTYQQPSGSDVVEIGTAVAYERAPDGSIRQVR